MSIVIPKGVTNMGESAFANNFISTINYPQYGSNIINVTNIANRAFYNNKLDTVLMLGEVKSIGSEAFLLNKVNLVQIPKKVIMERIYFIKMIILIINIIL